MQKKILVASIGIGETKVGYQMAQYVMGGKDNSSCTTPYMIDAIKYFCDVDKVILLGTVASAWDVLYKYLYDDNRGQCAIPTVTERSEDVYNSLLELRKQSNNIPIAKAREMLAPLKAAMGDFCLDIILFDYGVNDEEISSNISRICQIEDLVSDGDKLYFDITHSFRSLSLYELVAIEYLKASASKKISIEMVTYGMFEAKSGNTTPIVNLRCIVDLLDYIEAVNEYNHFGTVHKLCELLVKENNSYTELASTFMLINSPVAISDVPKLQELITLCVKVDNMGLTVKDGNFGLIASTICRDLAERFGNFVGDSSRLFSEFTLWQRE